MNLRIIYRYGGSTGSVLFEMAAAAILDFEKLLPFIFYLTMIIAIFSANFATTI